MKRQNAIVVAAVLILLAFGVGYSINRSGSNTQINHSPTNTSGTSLDLSGQQLTSLPDYVLAKTDLANLNLSNNQLTGLPDGIGKLTNLTVLNVENNRLQSLPASIGQLKYLARADFSNNRLTSLPTELGNLTQLNFLKLNDYKGSPADIDALRAKLPNTQIKTQ